MTQQTVSQLKRVLNFTWRLLSLCTNIQEYQLYLIRSQKTTSRWRLKLSVYVLSLQLGKSSTNTFSVFIYYLSLVWNNIWKTKTWVFNAPIDEYILRISKCKLHHRPLFYEKFITALFTQPVLKYVLKI